MNKIWQTDWLMLRNISPFVCFAHFQVYLQLGGSKHNERACSEKHKRRFHLSSASEPNNQPIGWCSLPVWSAQSTSPNARCVPSEHVLISQDRSTFALLFALRTHFYRKRIWDEAVSLSLYFEHCYSRNQHVSQASFRPSQVLIIVTTREAHSERSKSGFYVMNYTRPITFRQFLRLGNGFLNLDFPPLWKFIENSGFDPNQKILHHFAQNYTYIYLSKKAILGL